MRPKIEAAKIILFLFVEWKLNYFCGLFQKTEKSIDKLLIIYTLASSN